MVHGSDWSSQTKLEDLKEGTVLMGAVTSLMLYHGIQLDLGAEYDGWAVVVIPGPHACRSLSAVACCHA